MKLIAQVNVNFRLDEDVKRRMERACREMGLSMTTAFTMFATKVGNERRIPFEIAASPAVSAAEGEEAALREKRDAMEEQFARIRGALTRIVTAIPASACGMTIEQIRLLCADTLKEQTAAALTSLRAALSERKLPAAREKDDAILARYQTELSAILTEVDAVEGVLLPLLTAWNGAEEQTLVEAAARLTELSARLPDLQTILREFAASKAKREGEVASVQERLQRCAQTVSDPDVVAELRIVEALIRRCYEALDASAKRRLDHFYLDAVEHTAQELARAERGGAETAAGKQLCLRAIRVVSETVTAGGQVQRERQESDLVSEVVALERFAALRGDISAECIGSQ